MRKIAFFTEILIEDFDGASRTMFQLINRIDPKQFEYFFIYGAGPRQFQNYKSYKVPTLNIPANDDYSLAVPQLIKYKLEQALDEFAPEVIHIATPSLLGFYALNYAKKRNIPVLTIYHTHFISYIEYYFKNMTTLVKPTQNWVKRRMLSFYNRSEIVYVPSQNIINELVDIGIDKEKLTLWQRGIDTNLFSKKKKDSSYIQHITGNKKPNILFASRLVWEKNIKTLIEIYKNLKNENLMYNFIIVGDGTAKADAMMEMPEAIFLGKLDHEDLSKLYASADVFLFTSISETYGNVVIEAMASGLPAVIADGGGSSSLIQHGETGFKCSPDNASEYIFHIKNIISNVDLKNKIQANALQYIQQLDWSELANHYFKDLNELSNQDSLAWAN